MNKLETWFQAIAMAAAAWLASLPVLVILLLLLQGMDILTGLITSGMRGKLSSAVAFAGIGRKVIALLLVAVAGMTGWALGEYIGFPVELLVQAVAGFYCAHELLSILENAVNAGLPVPKALQELVQKLAPEVRPE